MKGYTEIDGKIYISSSRAHEVSGYSKDYIGQLCRGKKIEARMIGRSWYVNEDSLLKHKKEAEQLAELRNQEYAAQSARAKAAQALEQLHVASAVSAPSAPSALPARKEPVQIYDATQMLAPAVPVALAQPLVTVPEQKPAATVATTVAASAVPPISWNITYSSDERPLLPTLQKKLPATGPMSRIDLAPAPVKSPFMRDLHQIAATAAMITVLGIGAIYAMHPEMVTSSLAMADRQIASAAAGLTRSAVDTAPVIQSPFAQSDTTLATASVADLFKYIFGNDGASTNSGNSGYINRGAPITDMERYPYYIGGLTSSNVATTPENVIYPGMGTSTASSAAGVAASTKSGTRTVVAAATSLKGQMSLADIDAHIEEVLSHFTPWRPTYTFITGQSINDATLTGAAIGPSINSAITGGTTAFNGASLTVSGQATVGSINVSGGLTSGGPVNLSSSINTLLSADANGNVVATTSPSVAAIFATSTTATSTFAGAIQVGNAVMFTPTTDSLFIGNGAGLNVSLPGGTTAVGYQALASVTTGWNNTAIGALSGTNLTTGDHNTFLGRQSGASVTTGDSNVFLGNLAGGTLCASCSGDVYIGRRAGNSASSTNSVLIGNDAGVHLTGDNNIVLGGIALDGNNYVGGNNIFIGSDIEYPSANVQGVLNIGNLIFGTNLGATGSNIATGTVGIGTSTPSATFAVQGTGQFSGDLSVANLTATGTISVPNFIISGASPNTVLATDANGHIVSTSTVTANNFWATSSSAVNYFAGNTGIGTTSPSATFGVQGSAIISGNLTVGGNTITLGNSTSNTLTINSAITSDIIPNQNNTYKLGSPSFYWNDLYINNVHANNISAASTTIGGTTDNNFIINSDNASADAESATLVFNRGTVVPNAVLMWDAANKQFNLNQSTLIQNASTNLLSAPTFILKGQASQTGDLLQIASSSGQQYFTVGALGNVGIGSTSPSATLGVQGAGLFSGNVSAANLTATGTISANSSITSNGGYIQSMSGIFRGDDQYHQIIFHNGTNSTDYIEWGDTLANGGGHRFYTGGASPTLRMEVADDGTYIQGPVGIGTTSPATNLAVQGNGLFSGNVSAANLTATGTISFAGLSPNSIIATNGLSQLYATSTLTTNSIYASSTTATNYFGGIVGIGTSTPSQTLSVQGNGLFSGNVSAANLTATGTATINNLVVAGGTSYTGTGTTTFAGDILARGISAWQYLNAPFIQATSTSATSTFAGGIAGAGNFVVQQGSGNVGIGTTTPNQKLDVSVATGANMVLERPAVGTYNFGIGGGAVGSDIGDLQITPQTAGSGYLFQSSNAANVTVNALAIDKTGKVGIGTTTPTALLTVGTNSAATLDSNELLQVANTTSATTYQTIRSSGGTYYAGLNSGEGFAGTFTSNSFSIRTNSTDKLTVTSAGSVGIGTTSPNVRGFGGPVLTVGSGSASDTAIEVVRNVTGSDGTVGNFAFINPAAGTESRVAGILGLRSGADNSGALAFWTQSAGSWGERMRIAPSGNVGIGTTTPTEQLSLTGRIAFAKAGGDESNAGKIDYNNFVTDVLSLVGGGPSTNSRRVHIFDTLTVGNNPSTPSLSVNNSGQEFLKSTSASGDSRAEVTNDTGVTAGVYVGGSTNSSNPSTGLVYSSAGLKLMTNSGTATGGTGAMQFITGGSTNSPTMYITPGNTGSVGIGTTTPSSKFVVDNDGSGVISSVEVNPASAQNRKLTLTEQRITATRPTGGTNDVYLQFDPVNGFLGLDTASPLAVLDANLGSSGQAYFGTSGSANSRTTIDAIGGGRFFQDNTSGTLTNLIQTNGVSYINGGNVGIGTTTPNTKFEVFAGSGNGGDLQVSGDVNNTFLDASKGLIFRTGKWNGTFNTGAAIDSTGNTFLGYSGGGLTVGQSYNATTPPANGAIIQGNVGIGTTNPGASLQVGSSAFAVSATTTKVGIGTTNPQGSLGIQYVNDSTASIMIQHPNAAQLLQLGWNGTTDYSYINTSNGVRPLVLQNTGGNVGIGTTTPKAPLDVSSSNSTYQLRIDSGTGAGSGGSGIALVNGTGQSSWLVGTQNNVSGLEFTPSTASGGTTFSNPNMVILNGGNVGIGTTSPVSALAISATLPYISLKNTQAGGGTFQLLSDTSGGSKYFSVYDYENATHRIFVNNNGVGIGPNVTNPGASLDVQRTAADGATLLNVNGGASSSGYRITAQNNGSNVFRVTQTGDVLIDASDNNTGLVVTKTSGYAATFTGGNVGIGTTSPAALLSVGGNAIQSQGFYVDTNGVVGIGNSNPSASAQSLAISSAISTNGPITASIINNSLTSTKVSSISGIFGLDVSGSYTTGVQSGSTASVIAPLRVGSGVTIANSSNGTLNRAAGLDVEAPTLSAGSGAITTGASLYVAGAPSGATNNYALYSNSGNNYFGGNVGVGTTSPAQALSVAGNEYVTGKIGIGTTNPNGYALNWFNQSVGNGFLDFGLNSVAVGSTDTNLSLWAGGAAKATILTSGNVGIGTTTPQYKLHIAGNSDVAATSPAIELENTSANAANRNWMIANGMNNYGDLEFNVSPTIGSTPNNGGNKMTILSSGNVGIGTTNPGKLLDVNGTSNFTGISTYGNYLQFTTAAAQAGNADVITAETNTGTGYLAMQAGGGSAAFGGGLTMFAQSHPTYPGWVMAGIGSGSGGKFAVNSQGWIGGGTNVFTVDAGGNTYAAGNVGIGTTSPNYKLDVNGAIHSKVSAGSNLVISKSNGASITFDNDAGTTQAILQASNGANNLQFYTNSGSVTEKMRLNAAGGLELGSSYVGTNTGGGNLIMSGSLSIGTTSPGGKLAVTTSTMTNPVTIDALSDANTYGLLTFNGNKVAANSLGISGGGGTDNTLYLNVPTGGTYSFRNNWSPQMTIGSTGNLGIGTTTPTTNLAVVGSSPSIQLYDTGQTMPAGLYNINDGSDGLTIYRGVLGVNANARLRVDSNGLVTDAGGLAIDSTSGGNFTGTHSVYIPNSGSTYFNNGSNVGIGTTSPVGVLTVKTNSATPVFYLDNNLAGGRPWSIDPYISGVNNAGFQIRDQFAGSSRFVIDTSGNVGINATTPNAKLEISSGLSSGSNELLRLSNSSGNGYTSFNQYKTNSGNVPYGLQVSTQGGAAFNIESDAVGGLQRFYFTGGNVGIGTSSPGTGPNSSNLDVVGNGITSRNTSAGSAGNINIFNDGNTGLNIYALGSTYGNTFFGGVTGNNQAVIEGKSGISSLYVGTNGTAPLIFAPNRTAAMTIVNGGNVGIGTTSPSALLALAPSTYTNPALWVSDPGGTELITNQTDRDFSGAGDWTGTNWAVSGGVLQHTAGSTADAVLLNTFLKSLSIDMGNAYVVTFTISGRTTGNVIVRLGSAAGTFANTNATFTRTIVPIVDGGSLTFTPSSNFDGSIDNISVKRVSDRMFTVSGKGYVGIGTTTPSSFLSVAGGSIVQTAATNAVLVGSSTTGFYSGTNYAMSVAYANKYAYVLGSGSAPTGLTVFDVSDPTNPVALGSYNVNSPDTGAGSVVVSGRYAYVGAVSAGFFIIDVSNPNAPSLVSSLPSVNAGIVKLSGKYVYATDQTGKLDVIDVSNPASPVLAGTYPSTIQIEGLVVAGKYAYASTNQGGFLILDISNPTAPTYVSFTSVPAYNDGMYLSGKYLYVGNDGGINIYDISNPLSPTLKGSLPIGETDAPIVSGRYLYAGLNTAGFIVVDVSNPASPYVVSTTTTSGYMAKMPFAISGNYAYVGAEYGGFQIFKLNGTEVPTLAAGNIQVNTINASENAYVAGDLYAGGGLNVGYSGIASRGALAVTLGSTTATSDIGLTSGYFQGRLGTGTSTPYTQLASVSYNATTPTFSLVPATSQTADIIDIYNTSGTLSSVMTASGRLGLGTTTPLSKLDINGGVAIGSYAGSTAAPSNGLIMSGNMGIGTSSPNIDGYSASAKVLTISSASNSIIELNTTAADASGNRPGEIAFEADAGQSGSADKRVASIISETEGTGANNRGGNLRFSTKANNSAVFERMRITSAGLVGIGTTSPTALLGLQGAVGVSSNQLYLASNGNIGIGTTTPNKKLGIDLGNNLPGAPIDGMNISGCGLNLTGPDTICGTLGIGFGLAKDATGPDTIYSGMQFSATSVNLTGPDTIAPMYTFKGSVSGNDITFRDGQIGIGTTTPAALLGLQGAIGVNSSQLYLASSGNVGVGTIAPVDALNVARDRTDNGASDHSAQLVVSGSANVNDRLLMGYNTTSDNGYIQAFHNHVAATPLYLQSLGGGVGIATTSVPSTLTVTGSACFSQGAGVGTLLCGNAAGNIYYKTANTGNYDVAENYTTTDITVAAGDIVKLDTTASTTYGITKASSGDQVFGIVSTAPGMVLGGADATTADAPNTRPVALSGRVPVKVDGENGAIAVGDPITISSVPGVGMKALGSEEQIGVALQAWNGSATDMGTIQVFVSQKQRYDASQFTITPAGNVGIGSTSPMYKLAVGGDIAATSFVNVSTRTAKTDISYLDDSDKESILDTINGLNIAQYRYKAEPTSDPLRLGLIAEEAPQRVLAVGGKGVDIYKLATFTLAGVQMQQKQIKALQDAQAQDATILSIGATSTSATTSPQVTIFDLVGLTQEQGDAITAIQSRLDALTSRVDSLTASLATSTAALSDRITTLQAELDALKNASGSGTAGTSTTTTAVATTMATSTLQSILASVEQWTVNKLSASIIYADRVEAKTVAVTQGFDITDQVTGTVWCVTIKNGDWTKVPWSCETPAQNVAAAAGAQGATYTEPIIQSSTVNVTQTDVAAPSASTTTTSTSTTTTTTTTATTTVAATDTSTPTSTSSTSTATTTTATSTPVTTTTTDTATTTASSSVTTATSTTDVASSTPVISTTSTSSTATTTTATSTTP